MDRALYTIGWALHAGTLYLAGCGSRAVLGATSFPGMFLTYLFFGMAIVAGCCGFLRLLFHDSIQAHEERGEL